MRYLSKAKPPFGTPDRLEPAGRVGWFALRPFRGASPPAAAALCQGRHHPFRPVSSESRTQMQTQTNTQTKTVTKMMTMTNACRKMMNHLLRWELRVPPPPPPRAEHEEQSKLGPAAGCGGSGWAHTSHLDASAHSARACARHSSAGASRPGLRASVRPNPLPPPTALPSAVTVRRRWMAAVSRASANCAGPGTD